MTQHEDKLRALGRAITDNEKAQAMTRLFKAWKRMPTLRLGQLLTHVLDTDDCALYAVEDHDLVEAVERFVEKYAHV